MILQTSNAPLDLALSEKKKKKDETVCQVSTLRTYKSQQKH